VSQTSGYDPRNPGAHNLGATEYDPGKLVRDVVALLEDRGLTPILDKRPDAARETHTAACILLRGLGIQPGKAPEDWLDLDGGARYDGRMHGD
jgi:hypothetical protein